MNRTQKEKTAEIFYEAFYLKVRYTWIMTKDRSQAIRIMADHMRSDQVLVSEVNNDIAGAASVETTEKPMFIDIPFKSFIKEFGALGGGLRYLAFLIEKNEQRNLSKNDVHLDMIAVSREARGQGVGKQLLDLVDRYARVHDKENVVLEVVDSNPEAKSLYENFGYHTAAYEHMNLLFRQFTKRADFAGMYRMKKRME